MKQILPPGRREPEDALPVSPGQKPTAGLGRGELLLFALPLAGSLKVAWAAIKEINNL